MESDKNIYGFYHPETALSLFNIGKLYYDDYMLDTALPYLLASYKIYYSILYEKHEDLLRVENLLRLLYDKLGINIEYKNWLKSETNKTIEELAELLI